MLKVHFNHMTMLENTDDNVVFMGNLFENLLKQIYCCLCLEEKFKNQRKNQDNSHTTPHTN